MSKCETRLTLT